MLAIGSPIAKEALVLDWGYAEADRLKEAGFVTDAFAAKVRSRAKLNAGEEVQLMRAIVEHRGGFFSHLVQHLPGWYLAKLQVSAIGSLKLNTHFRDQHRVNGKIQDFRTVEELATGDPLFVVKGPFSWNLMQGHPMLVAEGNLGPWCVLEGTHRLVEINRLVTRGTVADLKSKSLLPLVAKCGDGNGGDSS